MELKKWHKILIAAYVIFILIFYIALIFEIDPFYTYSSTVELLGFILSIPLLVSGVKNRPKNKRTAWILFLIASLIYFTGDVIWAYNEDYLGVAPVQPSICDFMYLTNTVIFLFGLIVHLKNMHTINFAAISFDMFISIFAAAGIMYNFMLAPILANRPEEFLELFLTAVIPIIDFSMITGVMILIFGTDDRIIFNRENIFLTLAFLTMFALDEVELAEKIYNLDFMLILNPLWSIGCFIIAIASFYPSSDEVPKSRFFNFTSQTERTLLYSRMLIPYLYIFTILILIGAKYNLFDAIFWWAICLVIMISIRQILVVERNKKLLRTLRKSEEKLNLQNLELQRLNQQIMHDAEVDFLTQLSNRRYIDKTFERLNPPEGRAESLGILLIDVDFFKRINDTYGHPTGDFVLKEIAGKIKSVIRGGDVAGRFGGDEFIILLPESDLPIVQNLAAQLTKVVREDEELSKLNVTLSIGGTSQQVNHENYDVQLLLKHADEALYQAKEGGRNCYVVM